MSYCAIFERNLGEAIPSSSVSLCKTLLAYSVAEVNGYRYGRCFQRLIRRMFLYFFLPSFFCFFLSRFLFSFSSLFSRKEERGMCTCIARISGERTRIDGSLRILPRFVISFPWFRPNFFPLFLVLQLTAKDVWPRFIRAK